MTSPEYLALARHGLGPRTSSSKTVVIVGAGMAGLVAAYELRRAGHDPIVLEAQPRIGGRIFTMREPFAPGLYAEAGAMRIPKAHTLTLAYVEQFGLKTFPFAMNNRRAYYHLRGRRVRVEEAERDPGLLDFEMADHERGRSIAELWEAALRPIAQVLEAKGDAAWPEIVAEYDQYSVREFLEAKGMSEGAIEAFGLLFNQEALMNSSFLELLREEVGGFYTDMVQIADGMDRLPRALFAKVSDRVRLSAKMIALDQTPDEVIVHYQTLAGRFRVSGDYAIVTVPFPVLRHVEVLKPFSRAKQRAIRQLHYDASAKIFFQCRRRFWEEDDGIFGGGTVTDLPVRNVYYPEHGRETGRGVLLASYTWSEDAQRWGSLSPHDRIVQALENVALIHPQVTECFETGASKMWHDDEFAGGAYALFDPGQQTLLHEHIIAPEGRIHFAGEHASLAHAWIQGAIESGLRAAREIHHAPSH
ncbi:MAG: flavin monoamine oxidase family protein [Armatimonadota bacterium]|nr:flavin monoamine oxidase family protein [Armatimonadota bacterium]